jgi:2-dehydro-3-deoxyphosphooctonate aldolase (KDO 8-P synthase)
VLARSAVAAGVDGIFLEFHPDPDKALCDGPSCLALNSAEALLDDLVAIDAIVKRRKS